MVLMKIYTKTGDKGETSLYGGKRISKADLRIDSYGTVDELNAFCGLLRDSIDDNTIIKEQLLVVQNRLFDLGSLLATLPDSNIYENLRKISKDDIEKLEHWIDTMNEDLEPLKHFILPGGHTTISNCHVCRTVCRRAERVCVALNNVSDIDVTIIKYLNRLSDYFFVLCRKLASILDAEEIKWIP